MSDLPASLEPQSINSLPEYLFVHSINIECLSYTIFYKHKVCPHVACGLLGEPQMSKWETAMKRDESLLRRARLSWEHVQRCITQSGILEGVREDTPHVLGRALAKALRLSQDISHCICLQMSLWPDCLRSGAVWVVTWSTWAQYWMSGGRERK